MWQWPRPFQGQFVVRGLGLAMLNPHIKFEMSTITCNEEMKGNAKCENYRFEPPIGGLRGNVQGSFITRWKARGRLPISANWTFLVSSHDCCTIKRNLSKSVFSEGVGHFEHKCLVDGDVARNTSMGRWIEEWCTCSTTLPLEVFTHRNFVADVFRQKLKFTENIAKSRFVPPFGRVRGNIHGSSMVCWKARGRLPISAN